MPPNFWPRELERVDKRDRNMKRLLAIGDIHGHLDKLEKLIDLVQPTEAGQIVFLGDYIDRGTDSKGVIDCLIQFGQQFPQTIFLRGNHDQMLLDLLVELGLREGKRLQDQSRAWGREIRHLRDSDVFFRNGGKATLDSYNVEIKESLIMSTPAELISGSIPQEHVDFLDRTKLFYRQDSYIFAHAAYDVHSPEKEQSPYTLMWERYGPHGQGGETVVVGHTPSLDSNYRIGEGIIMLDTGAAYDGPLTCMDVLTQQAWQTPRETKELSEEEKKELQRKQDLLDSLIF